MRASPEATLSQLSSCLALMQLENETSARLVSTIGNRVLMILPQVHLNTAVLLYGSVRRLRAVLGLVIALQQPTGYPADGLSLGSFFLRNSCYRLVSTPLESLYSRSSTHLARFCPVGG